MGGWCTSSGIHMNARAQNLPTENCFVMRQPILLSSPVSGFKTVADQRRVHSGMWIFPPNKFLYFVLEPKVTLISQKILKKLNTGFVPVSLHHLCFNTTPGVIFCSVSQVTEGFSYLLRLPVLRDCTGPHSSLPALGTAEGVLHTHTHNIHTSRFKVLLDRLCEGKSREDGFLAASSC